MGAATIRRNLERLQVDPAWIAGSHHPEIDALRGDADESRAFAALRTLLIAAVTLGPVIFTIAARNP